MGKIDEEEKWPRYRFAVVFVNMITYMMLIAILVSFSISAPELKKAFSLTDMQLTYGYIIYMAGVVISAWWGGKSFDKFGMKKTMVAASLLFLIPQFLIPYTPSWSGILLLRFIQGNFFAMFPALNVLNGLWFPEKQHGLAAGIFMGGLCIGMAFGNFVCSRLIPSVGWQMTFIILGVIGVIVIAMWFLVSSRSPPKIEKHPEKGPEPIEEKKEISVYKMGATWLLSFILLGNCWQTFVMYGCTQTMLFHYEYSLKQVGTLCLALGLIGVPSTLLGGICSDRFSKRMKTGQARVLTMLIGFIIAFFAAFVVSTLSAMGFGWAMFAMLFLGWGVPWTNGGFFALPTEIFPKGSAGEGTGVATLIGNTADIFGPMLAVGISVVYGWYVSTVVSLAIPTLLSAILCVVLLYLLKRKEVNT